MAVTYFFAFKVEDPVCFLCGRNYFEHIRPKTQCPVEVSDEKVAAVSRGLVESVRRYSQELATLLEES